MGYKHTDGREQEDAPEGSKPEGTIALARAIPTMGALTSLDISSNNIGGYYTEEYPGQNLEFQKFTVTPEGIRKGTYSSCV